jgi:uncharacterized protein (DUF2252 family)
MGRRVATGELDPAPRSAAESAAAGRAVRRRLARRELSVLGPPGRDAVAIVRSQEVGRVADLIPIRYERMAASPLAFFRGSAAVMAHDLAAAGSTGLQVQLCGDAHLSNFGLFASPERQLVFDINDFDETLPGPWEWDLKRLVASLEVAARGSGFGRRARRGIVIAAAAEYRRAMREFAAASTLAVWHAHRPVDQRLLAAHLDKATARAARAAVGKARSRDHLRAFSKLVTVTPDGPRFTCDPPLLVPLRDLLGNSDAAAMLARVKVAMGEYSGSLTGHARALLGQYRIVDVARKVVGVGSVGTRAWAVLLLGRDETDPLLMQIKEAGPSVFEPFLGPSRYENAGHRVVAGQRLMQASGDVLLGWQRFTGFDEQPRDFYVRQLHDWKGSAEVEQMSAPTLTAYGRLCGWTLARAHARSGGRFAIAAYLGSGDRADQAFADYAAAAADQNAQDHAALISALSLGG